MTIFCEALPGCLESVLDDAHQVAGRTGATIRFKFNNETCEVITGRYGEPAVALFYADDHTLTA